MTNKSWKHLKVIGNRKCIERDHTRAPTKIPERNSSTNLRLQSKIARMVLGKDSMPEKPICQPPPHHQPHQELVRKLSGIIFLSSLLSLLNNLQEGNANLQW